MAAYNKFHCFVADVCNKVHNLASDTCKVVLTNSAPVASNTVIGNITQVANGNGYTTGGTAIASPSSSQTTGTQTFSGNNVTFTASGGTIGPFQYAAIYNDTAASDQLIAWFDYGSALTLQIGDTFTVAWNSGASSGSIFTMT